MFSKSTESLSQQQHTKLCFIGEIWDPFDEFQFNFLRSQLSIFHFNILCMRLRVYI